MLFPKSFYPLSAHLFPVGIWVHANWAKTGKRRDTRHLLHILLCFTLFRFTPSEGRGCARGCSRLLVLPHRLQLLGQQMQAVQQLPQLGASCTLSKAILQPPTLAAIPPSAASTEAELLSCQQLLTRGQFLRRIIVAKKKKKNHESWQPKLNLHAYLISWIFRIHSLRKYCKIIQFNFSKVWIEFSQSINPVFSFIPSLQVSIIQFSFETVAFYFGLLGSY